LKKQKKVDGCSESKVVNLHKGPDSIKTRMCVATRENKSVNDLVRIVLSPENMLVPDLKMNLPGRGAWVSARWTVVEQAVKKGVFGRAFSTSVTGGEALPGLIARLLRQNAISRVGLAKKAGVLVSGAAKVERQISKHQTAVLLHAVEAAEDGIRKIENRLKSAYGEEADKVPVINFFTTEELSLALGLENVIHAGIACKRNGANLVSAVTRLEQYDDR